MIKNLSDTSVTRWSQSTLDKVMAATPPPNDRAVKTHIGGGPQSDSWERKELAIWLRRTVVELVNQKLKLEGKETVDPDAYEYLSTDSPPHDS